MGNPEKIRGVALRIAEAKRHGQPAVIVVSAMGDTTDELLGLARKVTPATYERELDMLLTAGERISMALLSMALRDHGIEAISFTGSQAGIITDESHTRARIVEIRPMRVRQELEKGRVVIVAGFQGVSRAKEITTLGRGGSDTTAVALAVALGGSSFGRVPRGHARCEIFTDVAGIYSADPGLVPKARRYSRLSTDLMLEMAVRGAHVMHPRSIEIARIAGMPLFVGHSVTGEGTMIEPTKESLESETPRAVAVTARMGLVGMTFPESEAAAVLDETAELNLPLHDCRRNGEDAADGLSFVLDPAECRAFVEKYAGRITARGLSGVSVIGRHFQQNARPLSRAFHALEQARIATLRLTTHPQSFTVWISDTDASRAVSVLHQALIENTAD